MNNDSEELGLFVIDMRTVGLSEKVLRSLGAEFRRIALEAIAVNGWPREDRVALAYPAEGRTDGFICRRPPELFE